MTNANGTSTVRNHDCPVVNVAELLPRQHPSVHFALGLAVASLVGLGPLTGIPAIVLVAVVLREMDAANGQFSGAGLAKVAGTLGWVGSIAYGLIYGYVLSFMSTTGTFIVGLFGIALAVGWMLTRKESGVFRWLVPAAGLTLVVLSGLGFLNRQAADEAEMKRREASCAVLMADGEASLERHEFTVAEEAFEQAKEVCATQDSRTRAEQQSIEASTKEEARVAAEAEARRIREEQARAAEEKQRADEKASRDRKAKDDFERQYSKLAKATKTSTRAAKRGDLNSAQSDLREAVTSLERFAESPVADDPRWLALRKELAEARTALNERQKQARERREAQEARRAAATLRKKKKRSSWNSNRVQCCDGSYSPTCTYGRSLRGCCSHHGGVC